VAEKVPVGLGPEMFTDKNGLGPQLGQSAKEMDVRGAGGKRKGFSSLGEIRGKEKIC